MPQSDRRRRRKERKYAKLQAELGYDRNSKNEVHDRNK